MKIAIASNNNSVSGHFGHCQGFEIYTVEGKEIKENKFESNPGHRPGFLPGFLHDLGVNTIITGGMGESAQELFIARDIEVIVGAQGNNTDVINAYLAGELKSTGSVCHEHEHEDECK